MPRPVECHSAGLVIAWTKLEHKIVSAAILKDTINYMEGHDATWPFKQWKFEMESTRVGPF